MTKIIDFVDKMLFCDKIKFGVQMYRMTYLTLNEEIPRGIPPTQFVNGPAIFKIKKVKAPLHGPISIADILATIYLRFAAMYKTSSTNRGNPWSNLRNNVFLWRFATTFRREQSCNGSQRHGDPLFATIFVGDHCRRWKSAGKRGPLGLRTNLRYRYG